MALPTEAWPGGGLRVRVAEIAANLVNRAVGAVREPPLLYPSLAEGLTANSGGAPYPFVLRLSKVRPFQVMLFWNSC